MKYSFKDLFYITGTIIAVAVVLICIFNTFKLAPKYDDLSFVTGIIQSAKRVILPKGDTYFQVVLQVNDHLEKYKIHSIEKEIVLTAFWGNGTKREDSLKDNKLILIAEQNYFADNLGKIMTVGIYDKDVWNADIEGETIYKFSNRLDRVKSKKSLFRLIYLAILLCLLSVSIKRYRNKFK